MEVSGGKQAIGGSEPDVGTELIDAARAGGADTPTKSYGGRGAGRSSRTVTPAIKAPSFSTETEQNFQLQDVVRRLTRRKTPRKQLTQPLPADRGAAKELSRIHSVGH